MHLFLMVFNLIWSQAYAVSIHNKNRIQVTEYSRLPKKRKGNLLTRREKVKVLLRRKSELYIELY